MRPIMTLGSKWIAWWSDRSLALPPPPPRWKPWLRHCPAWKRGNFSRCCHSIFKVVTMIVPQPRIWPLFRGVSSTFSAMFTPTLHKSGTNWPLKNTPIFRIPSTLLLNHPYFRNFKTTLLLNHPFFYKSFIYIFLYKFFS